MALTERLHRQLETHRKNRELLMQAANELSLVDQSQAGSSFGSGSQAGPLTETGPQGVPERFDLLRDRSEAQGRLPRSIALDLARLRTRQQLRSENSIKEVAGEESESDLGGEIRTTAVGPFLYLSEFYQQSHLEYAPEAGVSFQRWVCSLIKLLLGKPIDCELSQIGFIDTETTGLSGGTGAYAFLVGIGSWQPAGFLVEQFFMRDFDEEGALLSALEERLGQLQVLITFNGKCFDLPLLASRFVLHRRSWPLNHNTHLDLLHPARRLWKLRLRDCSLGNLEKQVLGVERENDIPGHLIPQVYFHYARSGKPAALRAVLQHNRQDIRSLAELTLVVSRILLGLASEDDLATEDLFGAARYLELLGQRQRSLQFAEEVLVRGAPPSLKVQVLGELAEICRSARNYSRAVTLWREMINAAPTFQAEACENLAIHYEHRAKDFTRAVEFVDYAIRLLEGQGHTEKLDRWLHRRARLQHKIARTSY
jgi:uncharacterized protein YprB with RNaseH-like and TPR domain